MHKSLNYKKIFTFTLVVFILSLSLKFILCNRMAVQGNGLKDLFAKRSYLEKEISRLGFEDANLTSLGYVEVRAQSLGFIKMQSRLFSIDFTAPVQVAALSR